MLSRIKTRIADGNVLDLAVAFAIGLSIVGLITAVVQNVLMPIVNTLLGAGAQTTITIPLTKAQSIDISAVLQALCVFGLILVVASVVLATDKRKNKKSDAASRSGDADQSIDVTEAALSPRDVADGQPRTPQQPPPQ